MGFTVYKIENRVNGMIYIGVTRHSIRRRFTVHKCDATTGRLTHLPLYRAFLKYGTDNFQIESIEECEDLESMKTRERFWIKFLQSRAPNGYNVTDGGEAAAGNKRPELAAMNRARCLGKPLSLAHRRKVSEAGKGRPYSAASRKKQSDSMKRIWAARKAAN